MSKCLGTLLRSRGLSGAVWLRVASSLSHHLRHQPQQLLAYRIPCSHAASFSPAKSTALCQDLEGWAHVRRVYGLNLCLVLFQRCCRIPGIGTVCSARDIGVFVLGAAAEPPFCCCSLLPGACPAVCPAVCPASCMGGQRDVAISLGLSRVRPDECLLTVVCAFG